MRPKNFKKCMKLNWNFQRGGEVLEKNPFPGEGMDIFWNYKYKGRKIEIKIRAANVMNCRSHTVGDKNRVWCALYVT